ncbi:hypothetical protein [uncultured Phycicoccus sp.]|uniref:hypothetical protein n=1 Tax=uncultured Phycicoccus sp. TaxID=661422 RepID=UPI002608BE1E|nr:hypothetical protein [uncultured Phycicoccus sp.]
MTRTSRTRSARLTVRRVAGAVTSAAAVALVGTVALPAATAAAAGIVDDRPRPVVTARSPTALPASTSTGVRAVVHRWDDGRWVRDDTG